MNDLLQPMNDLLQPMNDLLQPMLAVPSTGAGNRQPYSLENLIATGNYLVDEKLDGIRALLHVNRSDLKLTNRQGTDITETYPDVVQETRTMLAEHVCPGCRQEVHDLTVFDGEIVATDGKFESILKRDRDTSASKVKQIPASFVAFDILMINSRDLRRMPLEFRRVVLTAYTNLPKVDFRHPDQGGLLEWVETLRKARREGVIAKHLNSDYQSGRRSPHWVKFKFTHRVSCILSSYQPGNGSRADIGSIHLALLDNGSVGNPVLVGRVGTGFTDAQIKDLKARLDAGEVLIAEIECLNVTSSGQLRFPVFRGLRGDLSPSDCSLAQLDQIPRC